ncbi:CLUMA_CG005890, isoform A [Clunio marinus]|uniref:CLUMA_CG005890, isoform A n=1 Tax=Clunio marinus TaxID=568069 RepID=A0A1J1HXQ9_9DIPT|nr:CLUMA_CG005890, isoform A [Clunio marinus]
MVQVIKDLGVDINSSMRILDGSVESSEFLASLNFNTNMLKARSAPLFKSVSQHKTDYGRNNPLERLIREFKQIQHEFDFHLTKNNFKTNLFQKRFLIDSTNGGESQDPLNPSKMIGVPESLVKYKMKT